MRVLGQLFVFAPHISMGQVNKLISIFSLLQLYSAVMSWCVSFVVAKGLNLGLDPNE